MNDFIKLQLSNIHTLLWDIMLQNRECPIEDLFEMTKSKVIIDAFYADISDSGYLEYSKEDYLADIKNLFVKSPPTKAIAESYELDCWLESSKRIIKEDRFNLYKKLLIEQGKGNSIEQLDSETFKILDSCHNPNITNRLWDRRGLVYGNVQSGKTSNFIGLINRAFDHGYKIVIVFTGVTEDLRKQTQLRVNSGILGINSGEDKGIADFKEFNNLANILSPTTINRDLSNSDFWLQHNISPDQKSIWVVKKNPKILEALINWLHYHRQRLGTDKIYEVPFLIIDDEADNASIQSMSQKDYRLWEKGQEIAGFDLDNLSPEQEKKLNEAKENVIKTINRNIRVILSLVGNKTFVGYTATPYSIINQKIEDIERTPTINDVTYTIDENTELFPEHFIIPIKPGPSYIGIERIYNANLQKRLPALVNISNEPFREDIELFFPSKRGADYTFNTLPESLIEAIYCFLVVIIVRKYRNHKDFNTMLIHTSHLTKNADYVYEKVNLFITQLYLNLHLTECNEINSINRILNDFKTNSKNKLYKEYFGRTEFEFPDSISKNDVINILNPNNESPFQIVSYHSSDNSNNSTFNRNLTYNYKHLDGDRQFCNYIVIGGNRLSRGLTLEGLSISYFVRSSTRQYSLYQMARWFGYRPGYEDLIKIFMPKDQILWFESVYKLEENLRKDFEENISEDSKIMPRDAIIKMAYHTPDNLNLDSKLLKKFPSICDPNKLKHTKKQAISFSGTTKSKKIINDKDIQKHNILEVRKFIDRVRHSGAILFNNSDIPQSISNNNINFVDVNYKLIVDLLKSQHLHEEITDDIRALIDFITKNSNELSNWSVVLAQKPKNAQALGEEIAWEMNFYDKKNILVNQKVSGLIRTPNSDSTENTLIFSKFLDKDIDNTFDIINDTNIEDYNNESDTNKSNKRYSYRNKAKKPILIIYLVSGVEKVNYSFPLFYITIPYIDGGQKVHYIVRNN